MILANTLLFGFFSIINTILDAIPEITIPINSEYLEGFISFINFCTYLFPVYALVPLFKIIIGLTFFRISVSLLKTIWSILPIV